MNVIVNGALGRMGQQVVRILDLKGHTVAAAVDAAGVNGIYKSLREYDGPADLVIDFSNHSCAEELAAYCIERKLPLVAATTGYTTAELHALEEAGKTVPVFQSYNMSLGVGLLAKLASLTAKIFGDCDVEIVEAHHNRKADAPSGTALMLADAVAAQRKESTYVFGRSGQCKRQPEEIGIHSLRMGNVVGEHEVIFGTDTQTITLKHQAHDRALFAEGAVRAAEFLMGQKPGFYHMSDLMDQ